jgi:hypothetical protein
MILWAYNHDDDRYKELEDWDKWTYYHTWIGDKHVRIPKPFEVGALFSTLFESAADAMTDEEDFGYFVDSLKQIGFETFAFNPVPQLFRPVAEQWANKSFFTGRPIEGMALQRLKPGERKTPWTSETMQLAGKLGIPPKRAEELIRGYFATVGTFILGISDIMVRQVADFPEKPTKKLDSYPLLGRFLKDAKSPRHTKYITRFYNIFNDVDELVGTVNSYKRLGDIQSAREIYRKNLNKLKYRKMLTGTRKALTNINAQIKRTMNIRRMTAEEKRMRIDKLTGKRNDLVRKAYEKYKNN